ncbi:hypothetical protein [Actinokineospora sp. NBRC 105648]|uniref:hypothetical protein n=1 Tax=Actinokineospora sp. NBRC 105648 TaxID=3032206 RepID=UPI00255441A2|nr:hypothetical protein [Actinokineospora sp. NBRC 105648]
MHTLIAWCGFFGAWLLVAGPVYQAALELHEQDVERDQLAAAMQDAGPVPRVSPWWWLLPPVRYWRQRKVNRAYRKAFMAALSAEQIDVLVTFINKATAWLFVGLGGLLIATKETYELAEHHEWPTAVFWVLVVVMVVLCLLNTAARMHRTKDVVARPA